MDSGKNFCYFTCTTNFDRLLSNMAAQYSRFARAYGAVRLSAPSEDEERAISAFFDRDYHNQALIRISLADFERQLQKKFPDISLQELLMQYSPIITTSAALERPGLVNNITSQILPKYSDTPAAIWLKDACAHMYRAYKRWGEQYNNAPAQTLETFDKVAAMLNNLPQEKTKLIDFAAQFGIDASLPTFTETYGALLLRALACICNEQVPTSTDACAGLYYKCGILTYSALSQVLVQNLQVDSNESTLSTICKLYNDTRQAHVLTLENIAGLSHAFGIGGKVFVLESPLVFEAVRELTAGVECTLVLPLGTGLSNHNTAFVNLMELLCNAGSKIYYAGNMDFKGLTRADYLYKKFGKSFIPWRYTRSDYEIALTGGSYTLPDEKGDLSMNCDDLALILSQLRKTGRSASSNALIPYFVQDIMSQSVDT